MDIKVVFGQVLRGLRKEKGVSQEKLALEAGIDRSYISKLETGVYQPSIATLFSIAEVLDVEPCEIVRQVSEVYSKEG